jgi:RND family efflux transporter MFP subunit
MFLKPLGPVWLVLAIAIGCSRAPAGEGGPPPQNQSVPVKVQEVKSSLLEDSSEFVGTLEAAQKVDLRPRVEGRIEKLWTRNGARVEQGALLVELQPTKDQAQLRAATENINIQRANLNSVRAELGAAEAQQAQAAAQVQSAQATLQSQEAEIQVQEAEIKSQQAELKLRQDEFNRTQFLVAQGVQSQQNLDEKTRNLDAAKAAVESARAALASAKAIRNSRAEALNASRSALKEFQERVRASRATLDREQANVKQAEAQQESVTQDFQFTRVTAPIAGMVGDIPIKVGDVVNSNTVLTTITQNDKLDLRLSIPIERSEQLRLGLPVELLLDGDRAIQGNVSFVSPQVDRTAQSILAKATFPNSDENLRDGQIVKAKVIWSKKQGVAIPSTAVSRIGGQAFVFIAEPAKDAKGAAIAQQKPIALGPLQGQDYQVLKGVEVGDKIVVEGVLKLRDGAPINPNPEPTKP